MSAASGKQRRDTAAQDALLQLQALHDTHREATRLFLMAAMQGATDAQIAHALRQGLPQLTYPASLHDSRAGKQPEGTGTTEEGGQPAQKKRRQATQTQPALLAPDAFAAALGALRQGLRHLTDPASRSLPRPALLAPDAFAAALGAIPAEDWCRTWAAARTIMLRRTSKRVKELVDKMRLPAVVRLSSSFWGDARNGTAAEKLQVVMRQLTALTAQCRISTLALRNCDMKGQDAELLAGVLAQSPALKHLDLCGNTKVGAAGAESLAGVLGQCRELLHLYLNNNQIGPGGAESLARMLGQCTALAHLDLSGNYIRDAGAASLAGVLAQCSALVHLNLSHNWIGAAGTEQIAGVLGQCAALTHLDLCYNNIGPNGVEGLAGVLGQCASLAHLNLSYNTLRDAGAESLAGMLAQCTALAHLNLRCNEIGQAGAESFAGVLAQCPALAHLDLSGNDIEAGGGLRASWRGQASGLLL
jgi:Ran GTPase-activating protein (RanGAP) involved in mRNA processing and transport